MTSIPVINTIVESFSRVFKNLPKVFSVGLVPLIAYFAIVLVGSVLAALVGTLILKVLFDFVAYFVMGLFALNWLRFVLDGLDKPKFELGPREQKFLTYYALLMAPVLLLLIIGAALQSAGFVSIVILFFLALMIVGGYTMVQLAFPAAARGEPVTLEKTWNESVPIFGPMLGINMLMFLAIAIPLIIVLLIIGLISIQLIVSAGMGGLIVAILLSDIIFTPIIFVAMALMVTALALVYRNVRSGGAS